MPPTFLVEENLPEHIKYWTTRYDSKTTGWLINNAHPFLLKNPDLLLGGRSDRVESENSKKIFVPLCGTTHDLLYLLSLGFEVFGVEGVKSCFEVLNERDGLGLVFNEKESTYETPDGRLKIYYGDLYKCPIEKWGPFDCVWDRASLIAIDMDFRPSYADIIKRSLGSNSLDREFRYIIEVVSYDKSLFQGPPKCVTEEDLKTLYPEYKIEILQDSKITESSGLYKTFPKNFEFNVDEVIYMLKPRKQE